MDRIIVKNESGAEIAVTDNGDETYTYVQPAGEVTIEVTFKLLSYKVVWTDGDGASYEKNFNYGEVITIPTNEFIEDTFRKTGYTLTGWQGYTEGMTMPAEGVTFTAVYSVNKYTVTYKVGEQVISTQTVEHGKDASAPQIPQKDGYDGKWDKDGKNITGDTVISAIYTEVTGADPNSPQTGDNSNLWLWFALLFVSGMGIFAITVYDRKRKTASK